MKSLLPLVAAVAALLTSGCAMNSNAPYPSPSAPTVITANGASVTLSVNDQKALNVCANVEAGLPVVKAGTADAISLAFSLDPTLGTDYGAQMWAVSSGVNSLATGTLPTPTQFGSQVLAFTSGATAQQAVTIDTQVQAVQSLYQLAYNKLTAAAGTTTNTYVLGVISKTGVDLLTVVSGGVAQATQKYAPVTVAMILRSMGPFINWRTLRYV